MRRHPKEVEAKFIARGPSLFRKLERLKDLGPFRLEKSLLKNQENLYWDTEDLELRKAQAVLKTRRVGRESQVTFKRELSYRGGVSERVEVSGPRAKILARKIAGRRPLKEILNLRTRRRQLLFSRGKQTLELDLDRVEVRRGGRTIARHWEVELENRGAPEAEFRKALGSLKRTFRGQMRASRVPKVELGLRALKRPRGKGRAASRGPS